MSTLCIFSAPTQMFFFFRKRPGTKKSELIVEKFLLVIYGLFSNTKSRKLLIYEALGREQKIIAFDHFIDNRDEPTRPGHPAL